MSTAISKEQNDKALSALNRTGRSIITTYTGRKIELFNFNANDVCIQDIAQSLAKTCRYNGHTHGFYSVAQHSVHVSMACPQEYKLWGLLHDAAECYIGDCVRPLKKRIALFNDLETMILCRIAHVFKLEWPMPQEVMAADDYVLNWELRRFEAGEDIDLAIGWEESVKMFMEQYKILTNGGGCPCGCSV